MKKIIYILILMSILNSLGCRFKEERFLEKHDVIFSNTEAFEKFVTNANIKLEKAKEIKVRHSKEINFNRPSLLYFIIDGNYVFTSHVHLKIPDASVSGIWVNATTGHARYVKSDVYLMAHNRHKFAADTVKTIFD